MDWHHVLEAGGILISGLLFYSYTYNWFPSGPPGPRQPRTIVGGVAFGALAVVLMVSRIQIADGVYIDARALPVALIGLFEGWPAAFISAAMSAIYRLVGPRQGGAGAPAGIIGILAVAAVASLVHEWAKRSGRVGPRHAFALSALVFLSTAGAFAVLGSFGLTLFAAQWLGYVIMSLIGVGLIARLFRDVVEQHRLVEVQQRFRAIIDEATDAIRIVDPETLKILDANHADCTLSGYARDELIGRDVRDFWAESGPGRVERETALAETHAKGFARALGAVYRRRTGELVSVDATHRLVSYRGRRYEIVIYRDASERVSAESARRESAELRSVTLLARATAHEINNPLAVILGAAQLLIGRVADGSAESRWLQQLLDATARIREAVWRLNHVTRVVSTEERDGAPGMLDTARSSEPPPVSGIEPAAEAPGTTRAPGSRSTPA
jgi:PAS domain S-box-containing protein